MSDETLQTKANDSTVAVDPEAAAAGSGTAFEFEGWGILELMGHRKLGGAVRMNGPLIRIDVFDDEKHIATQWYGAHALYCLTPTTEAVAKALTRSNRPVPVAEYELEAPRQGRLGGPARLRDEFQNPDDDEL